MMKIVVMSLAFLLTVPHFAHACEPCAQRLDWQQTARDADLIVLGRKLDDGPADSGGGPDWIDLKVDDELHGTALSVVVRVNSWDGMCPYGIDIPNGEPHLIFLKSSNLSKTKTHYTAVAQGCGAKALPIIDDHVVVDSTRIPVTRFMEQLRQHMQK
ncbi:MAG: hypothetical protein K8I00_08455 [Candidatus Omnitrophica bacterium]|nr:hypothetical protein [Candidatus Omnitrophota bacterium]